ncbi:hypothetical protein os1_06440 [Comamonadaceae bacterium OS-1]|nr:hypothetical protein os1_06440 [Comamonadaceae bacterium OS-1]
MKITSILVAIGAVCVCTTAFAGGHAISGYVTKNGTYVAPSYATNPNGTKADNYSTQGNVNPYTGKAGTVDPFKPQQCGTTADGRYVCR